MATQRIHVPTFANDDVYVDGPELDDHYVLVRRDKFDKLIAALDNVNIAADPDRDVYAAAWDLIDDHYPPTAAE
jgi:hypothetical protein